ncbi:MAG: protease pro-enzyme activation domain-containing protein [Chloroflexota bacterium]
MSRSTFRHLATLAFAVVVGTAACGGAPAPTRPITGELPAARVSVPDRDMGPADPTERIRFSFDLRMPGAAELDAALARISDPSSPDYRHFLTADEIGDRFGLPADDVAAVESTIRNAGLTVVTRYRQRTALLVEGSAAAVGRLLGVDFHDRLDSAGRRYHAPVGAVSIPASLASSVTGVRGLTNSLRPAPATTAANLRPVRRQIAPGATDLPASGLKPSDVLTAYDIQSLRDAGIDGTGQTIAVVSFDTFRDADVKAFDQAFGITTPLPKRIPVGEAVSPGEGAVEVDLDVQVIRSIAPRAQILNFEANQQTPFSAILDAIVSDGRAKIVSISWGACEDRQIAREIASEEPSFRRAAEAQGITIFVASGDNGAYCSRREDPTDTTVNVSWPATSPSVVSVGGTLLSMRTDRTYLTEAGWEDPLTGGGTGGGVSAVNERPAWQTGNGVQTDGSTGMRQVPDVAGPADPDSGFVIFTTEGDEKSPSATIVGGTSAAAPFWAASTALAAQLAANNGNRNGLGFIGPTLYQIANGGDAGAFHDVTRGGNLRQRATPGWDFATGLGGPDVAVLARALAAAAPAP